MNTANHKTFTFDKIQIFFKHTDYHGYVHPYNYLEWTSYVREAFFQKTVPNFREILDQSIKMMTARISSEFFVDSAFGDFLEARMTIAKIKKVSFDVIVRFFKEVGNQMVCTTRHTLVFVDSETQKFADIPFDLKKAVSQYQEDES